MSPPVFICTGSNRGIGRAIVESLAAKGPAKVIYATSRGGQDLGVHATHDNVIKYARLDVTDRQSIDTLREEIEGQYGEVQAVINNAGRNIDDQPYSFDAVDQTLATNVYGVINVRAMDSAAALLTNGRSATPSYR
jgi:NAD(P)-dependent dehydrogenase (short-subunit alcohol dehydrogenase family)